MNKLLDVPNDVRTLWNEKKKRGDVQRMYEANIGSVPTLIKALKHGRASQRTMDGITGFFMNPQ